MIVSGKPQLNRKINLSLLLDLIRKTGPISRAEMSKQTGIRATSISDIVQQLLDQRLVREVGLGRSTGGRQPVLLELNPSGFHAAGIEIRETGLSAVLVDFVGRVIFRIRFPLRSRKVEPTIDQICSLIQSLPEKSGNRSLTLGGIGIAVPGVISKDDSRVLFSRQMKWKNVDLRNRLAEKTGLDIRVMNNAIAGALAADYEMNSGAIKSMLFLLVNLKDTSSGLAAVGSGIVMEGRAYLGDGHMAGEMRVDIPHPLTLAIRKTRKNLSGGLSDLILQSHLTPEKFKKVWDPFSEALSGVIARGVDFLNPGKIVIGSDTPELEELIGESIRAHIWEDSIEQVLFDLNIEKAQNRLPIEFLPIATETLAKGAIVPHLQELSLSPLLRAGVLM